MNATVEAAWIAAGVGLLSLAGTVTVAIIGYRNTRKVALEAARNERLWDKMAAAYEEVLIALLRRQTERTKAATLYRDPKAEETMREGIARPVDPGWFEEQGRVIAYSSPEVRAGLELVRRADQEVFMRFMAWQSARQRASKARESGNVWQRLQSSGELRELMDQGLEGAEKVESALIDLIRAELQGKDTARLAERIGAVARDYRMWRTAPQVH